MDWHTKDVNDTWRPGNEPCPSTRLQALIDRRFRYSVDVYLWWGSLYNEWYGSDYFRTGDLSEWNYEEGSSN